MSAAPELARRLRAALAAAERAERRMERAALLWPGWLDAVEERVPPKAAAALRAAFAKAFAAAFAGGSGLIERSCRPEELAALYAVRSAAVERGGGRAGLRRLYSGARRANAANTLLTTAEGIGLGALGIGLPDIALFLGVLLRGLYSTAMNYGFDCSSAAGRLTALKIMRAALSGGEERRSLSREIDARLETPREPGPEELSAETEAAASAFATGMLAAKFVQGLPVAGVIGGAANPLYYRRITSFAEIKYRQGCLRGLLRGCDSCSCP